MGALPKKKATPRRRGARRSHDHLKLPALTPCPQCREPKLAHRVCLNCGTYNGRQVLEVKAAPEKS